MCGGEKRGIKKRKKRRNCMDEKKNKYGKNKIKIKRLKLRKVTIINFKW